MTDVFGQVKFILILEHLHRLLCLGVPRVELRRYGTPDDHDRAYGLDARGLAARLAPFFRRAA